MKSGFLSPEAHSLFSHSPKEAAVEPAISSTLKVNSWLGTYLSW